MLKTRIFLESSVSKIFLFECARHYASKGYPVHYVSKYSQQDREYEKITFVTTPSMTDFIGYLSYLSALPHQAQIPKAIIVENIDVFYDQSSPYQMAHLCAFVKQSAYFCSRARDNEASLIISCKFNFERLVLLSPHKIWRCDESKYDKNRPCKYYYRLLNVPLMDSWHPKREEIEFSSSGKDENGRIRLNNISSILFDDDDNICRLRVSPGAVFVNYLVN